MSNNKCLSSNFHMNLSLGLCFPAFPCTRWPTLTWAGSWRARRSRKHFVHQSKNHWSFEVCFNLLLMMMFHFWSVFLSPDCYGSSEPNGYLKLVYLGVGACWRIRLILSLQQEDQAQSTEEESSEEFEDNAQIEPICQDGKTPCHPQA